MLKRLKNAQTWPVCVTSSISLSFEKHLDAKIFNDWTRLILFGARYSEKIRRQAIII